MARTPSNTSKSQSLMQAAGGSGFIGFSAFQTSSKSSPLGQQAGEAGDGKELARGDTKAASKGRVKTAKVDGRYSAGSDGQVRLAAWTDEVRLPSRNLTRSRTGSGSVQEDPSRSRRNHTLYHTVAAS